MTKDKRPKRGARLASILGGVASSVIGLAYEGISIFYIIRDIRP